MPAIAPAEAALRRSSSGSSRSPLAYQPKARCASNRMSVGQPGVAGQVVGAARRQRRAAEPLEVLARAGTPGRCRGPRGCRAGCWSAAGRRRARRRASPRLPGPGCRTRRGRAARSTRPRTGSSARARRRSRSWCRARPPRSPRSARRTRPSGIGYRRAASASATSTWSPACRVGARARQWRRPRPALRASAASFSPAGRVPSPMSSIRRANAYTADSARRFGAGSSRMP